MDQLFKDRAATPSRGRTGTSGRGARAPLGAWPHAVCAVLLVALWTLLTPAPAAAGTVTMAPASGPSGTPVFVEGLGFGNRRQVTVRVGGAAVARASTTGRGSFRTSFALHGRRSSVLKVVFRAGGSRVVSNFRVVSKAAAVPESEVSSGDGTRVRWKPTGALPGARIDLSGRGFRPRRKVSIHLGPVSLPFARTDRRGNFFARPPVPPVAPGPYALDVRAGLRRARFRFWVLSASGPRPAHGGLPRPTTRAPARPRPPAPPVDTPPPPAPQPNFPIRAAFYYPWFPEAWTQSGISPFTKYRPSLGYYGSAEAAVRRAHLRSLEYANFDAGIYSWWGQGHRTDIRFPGMLAETRSTRSPIKWALYHEREGNGPNPTVDQIGSDLDYIRANYVPDPSYLTVDGRPVLFVYADGTDDCTMADRWEAANTESRDFYVVLKVFAGYRSCLSQPDAWHQYAPSSRSDRQRGYAFVISPEFDLTGPEPQRLPRDLAAFEQAARDMVASDEPWQLVTTFNEWGENSAVESAEEWPSASGHGQFLDVLAGL